VHVESNHYEKNNGNVEFFLSLVPLELAVVLLDKLSVRLEQTTTVLGPDGKGQTSDEDILYVPLLSFRLNSGYHSVARKLG
jgi:hypothetical protein